MLNLFFIDFSFQCTQTHTVTFSLESNYTIAIYCNLKPTGSNGIIIAVGLENRNDYIPEQMIEQLNMLISVNNLN